MLVSYEPDFGYEERIDYGDVMQTPSPDGVGTRSPTGWYMLRDVISRYPRFERVLNVLEKLKQEKIKNPPRRKAKRIVPAEKGKSAVENSLSNIYFENEELPSKFEERMNGIRFAFEDF